LIVSDVDETVADLYTKAPEGTVRELETLLKEEKALFFVSGQRVGSIFERVVSGIEPKLRRRIVIGHCSGAEVYGFDEKGSLLDKPFYSLYEESFSDEQKRDWREVVRRLAAEFGLKVFPPMPVREFERVAGDDPLAVMLEDRGPQITLEFVNGHAVPEERVRDLGLDVPATDALLDLRAPVLAAAGAALERFGVPVEARPAGVFAVDFVVRGVSKTTAVERVLADEALLAHVGLERADVADPDRVEVWGDKFSVDGGTDWYMSVALPKRVRSITFREEDPTGFPDGHNIVVWDGEKRLHEGLGEFLASRRGDSAKGASCELSR
jgi:hypothetical protein